MMKFNCKLMLAVISVGMVACAIGDTCALALPSDRHYEMVSPPFKNGYGVRPQFTHVLASSNGENVEFSSDGVFDGAPAGYSGTDVDYIARRGAAEWITQPVVAPAALIAAPLAGDLTSSLNRVLVIGAPGLSKGNVALEQDAFTHLTETADSSANWEHRATILLADPSNTSLISLTPGYLTSDDELCHSLISANGTEPLLPETVGMQVSTVYELNLGCHGESPSTTLVALDNKGGLLRPTCASSFGGEKYEPTTNVYHAFSGDASEVFFTTCVSGSGEAEATLPHQLFVRLAGAKTLEISRPVGEACEAGGVVGEVPCAGADLRGSADFEGASEDGSAVYFTAPLANGNALVPGDADASTNLYVAGIGCAQGNSCTPAERVVTGLVEASHDPNPGGAAEVMGVVRTSPDGSRAYFVAGGDLLNGSEQASLEAGGHAIPRVGAANLYEFDKAGGIKFIGDLCSGRLVSGTVEDAGCPGSQSDQELWQPAEGSPAQTTGGDGRYLVFTTYAQLTSDDVNEASDVYRFDTETGRITRVSQGERGDDDNGNRRVVSQGGEAIGALLSLSLPNGRNWAEHEMNSRAISEDGTKIVFLSAEPLSGDATNGLLNVYEWREVAGGEGMVSLISGGTSEAPSAEPIISASGRDVFFVTAQGLEPQDTDGLNDVYDARGEAGFLPVPAAKKPCSNDACQGPLTAPAPVLLPGSVGQMAGENLTPPAKARKTKVRRKAVKCKKGYRRKKGRCVKVAARRSVRGGRER